MFDVSFPELMVVAVVALLILGPDKLPVALRTLGLWLGRLRRQFMTIKGEVEREIGMDEVRRQLHNESIMHDLKRIEQEVRHPAVAPLRQASATPPAVAPAIAPAVAPKAEVTGTIGSETSATGLSDTPVNENGGASQASRQG